MYPLEGSGCGCKSTENTADRGSLTCARHVSSLSLQVCVNKISS